VTGKQTILLIVVLEVVTIGMAWLVAHEMVASAQREVKIQALETQNATLQQDVVTIRNESEARIAQIEKEKKSIRTAPTAVRTINDLVRPAREVRLNLPEGCEQKGDTVICPPGAPPLDPLQLGASMSGEQLVAIAQVLKEGQACQVQLVADKQIIGKQDEQITNLQKEVVVAKGGSKFKRVMKRVGDIALGIGLGALVGGLVH
jgi:hypothetical protein